MSREADQGLYGERKAFFNEVAEGWMDMLYKDPGTGQYTRHKDKFHRLFTLMPIRPGDRVLDVGCGCGILAPYLLERVGKEGVVFELDYAERMIAENQRLHTDERLRFIVSDIVHVPLSAETCDAVICFASFPHFDDKEAATRAMAGLLRENGRLAVAHFESSQDIKSLHEKSGGPVRHDVLPDREEMQRLFDLAGLKLEHFTDETGFYFILGRKGRR